MIEEIPNAKEVVNRLFEHQTTLSETGVVVELREKRLAVVAREQSEGCSGCGASVAAVRAGEMASGACWPTISPMHGSAILCGWKSKPPPDWPTRRTFYTSLPLSCLHSVWQSVIYRQPVARRYSGSVVGSDHRRCLMVGTLGVFRFGTPGRGTDLPGTHC